MVMSQRVCSTNKPRLVLGKPLVVAEICLASRNHMYPRDTGMVLGSRGKGGSWLGFWRLLGDQEHHLHPRKPIMGFLPVVFVCGAGG